LYYGVSLFILQYKNISGNNTGFAVISARSALCTSQGVVLLSSYG